MSLGEFLQAPEQVQEEFMARLARQVEADVAFDRYLCEILDDDPCPPEQPEYSVHKTRLTWGETWSKRARGARARSRQEGRDFEAERLALQDIEPVVYFPALTDQDVRGYGSVCCPLHEDRLPSLSLSPQGWYCHACGVGGGIYQLAGALWGLNTKGDDFKELHDRLTELMGVRREFQSAS